MKRVTFGEGRTVLHSGSKDQLACDGPPDRAEGGEADDRLRRSLLHREDAIEEVQAHLRACCGGIVEHGPVTLGRRARRDVLGLFRDPDQNLIEVAVYDRS